MGQAPLSWHRAVSGCSSEGGAVYSGARPWASDLGLTLKPSGPLPLMTMKVSLPLARETASPEPSPSAQLHTSWGPDCHGYRTTQETPSSPRQTRSCHPSCRSPPRGKQGGT